jgi:hypothetical protein
MARLSRWKRERAVVAAAFRIGRFFTVNEALIHDAKRQSRIATMPPPTSAFDEHKDELDHYEQMFGRERGRLAVSLDRLTNALVLVGQHGIYCSSQRNPMVPAMDLRMIVQELIHAKELTQSVMEELRRAKEDQSS